MGKRYGQRRRVRKWLELGRKWLELGRKEIEVKLHERR